MPMQYYSELANQYDSIRLEGIKGSFLARTDAALLKELFSVARSNAPTNKMFIHDVPVGAGRSLVYLKQENIDIIACVSTREMLQIVRRKAEPNCLGLIQGDASTLPLPNESMDCIFALRLLFIFFLPIHYILFPESSIAYGNRWESLPVALRMDGMGFALIGLES